MHLIVNLVENRLAFSYTNYRTKHYKFHSPRIVLVTPAGLMWAHCVTDPIFRHGPREWSQATCTNVHTHGWQEQISTQAILHISVKFVCILQIQTTTNKDSLKKLVYVLCHTESGRCCRSYAVYMTVVSRPFQCHHLQVVAVILHIWKFTPRTHVPLNHLLLPTPMKQNA